MIFESKIVPFPNLLVLSVATTGWESAIGVNDRGDRTVFSVNWNQLHHRSLIGSVDLWDYLSEVTDAVEFFPSNCVRKGEQRRFKLQDRDNRFDVEDRLISKGV
jgi:hypothetical protein